MTQNLDATIAKIRHEQEEAKLKQLAASLKMSSVDLVGYPISESLLRFVELETARALQVVPYLHAQKELRLASPRPVSKQLKYFLTDLSRRVKLKVSLALCSQSSFNYALNLYQQLALRTKNQDPGPDQPDWQAVLTGLKQVASQIHKVSTTQLLDLVLAGAILNQGSDVHIEPDPTGARLRYRVDGVLEDITHLDLDQSKALRQRVKYLAKMKLNITGTPQDGRFSYRVMERSFDVRASSLPSQYGEALALRLLGSSGTLLSLDQLDLDPTALVKIKQALQQPNGMIIVTGPTGSGKTTTLYAILDRLNQPGRKIITIEDPIEYRLAGVEQTQINQSTNYTFSNALRSVMRQDPDVIMVGEIRDPETARISLQAAITGHLVLTTLHTNNAPAAIPRLLDMGVEPYLLAGSIRLIVGQRLVRKLSRDPSASPARPFQGRIPIVEALEPTSQFNQLINNRGSIDQFYQLAKQLGMKTMFQDGRDKVAAGLTSQTELERVASG